MSWQILVLISVFAGSFTTLTQKRLADKKLDPVALAILSQLLGGAMIAIFALTQGLDFTGILHYWPNLIAMVLLWSGFNVLNLMALGKVQASHFMILFQTRVIWTLLIAIFVLREIFTLYNGIGLALIIAAIFVVTPLHKLGKLTRGDIYVFLAALCFGLGVGNDAIVLKGIASPVTYTIITMLTPPLLLLAIFPKSVFKMEFLKVPRSLGLLVLMSFFFATALVSVYVAYNIGNAAIIAPLTQSAAIVTVILSIIFLGERDRPLAKLTAIAISFIGVLLLI